MEHMKKLWESIDFKPLSFELNMDELNPELNVGGDVTIKDKAVFSPNIKRPKPSGEDIEKYGGVAINNFPNTVAKYDMVSFLQEHGLPDDFNADEIVLNNNKNGTNVEICPLVHAIFDLLIKKIHFSDTWTKFFDRPLY